MAGLKLVAREPPVARRVVDQLLDGIRDGRYPVGGLLPSEQEIAQLCGVSRPSVREALSALQFAGYVEAHKGTGTVVVRSEPEPPRAEDPPRDEGATALLARLEARLVLEPEVLALAAADPDPVALDAAAELVDGMGVAIADPDLRARTDRGLHAVILASCRNAVLREQALQLLDVATHPHWRVARERAWAGGDLPALWAQHHRRIVEAVIAGDPAAAAGTARAHLESVAANLRDQGDLPASERRELTAVLERSARRRAPAGGVPGDHETIVPRPPAATAPGQARTAHGEQLA